MTLLGRRVRLRLWPSLAALPVLLVLLGLGAWQLERREWKQELVADLEARAAAAPIGLDEALADPAAHDFSRVAVEGRFLNERELTVLGRSFQGVQGRLVVTPLLLDDGRSLLVARGWVPESLAAADSRPDSLPQGRQQVIGLLRLPADRAAAASGRGFYGFDLPGMAAAAGLERPITAAYLAAEDPDGTATLPVGQAQQVDLPDNHLQYALTWFSLAVALLAIVFLLQSRPAGRSRRLLLVEPRLAAVDGHYAAQAALLAEAGRRLGFAPQIACHRSAPAAVVQPLAATAVLSQPPAGRDPAPGFDGATAASLLAEDFRRLGRGLTRDDVVILPSLWPFELQALAAWMTGPAAPPGPVAALLHIPEQWTREAAGLRDGGAALADAAARLAALPRERQPRLFAYTDGGAARFAEAIGLPVGVLPVPFVPPREATPAVGRIVATAGSQRADKGLDLLPAIAAALARRLPDWRWSVNGEGAPALAGLANVELVPPPVSWEAHLAQLQAAALVLLPYRSADYRDRVSGVFCEAVALARPCLVPAGTSLAAEVEAGRAAGLVFPDGDAEAMAATAASAASRLAELAAQALALAPAWRERHDPAAVLARLLDETGATP